MRYKVVTGMRRHKYLSQLTPSPIYDRKIQRNAPKCEARIEFFPLAFEWNVKEPVWCSGFHPHLRDTAARMKRGVRKWDSLSRGDRALLFRIDFGPDSPSPTDTMTPLSPQQWFITQRKNYTKRLLENAEVTVLQSKYPLFKQLLSIARC